MSASINPDIVTDGLVLCYDAANSDCYRGEPTTNLITSNFIAGGNTTVVLSDEIDQYGITRSLNKATINSTTGWARIYINSSIGIPVINQNYTISMWIKRSGATEVRAGWEPEVGPADGYRRPEVEYGYYGIAGGPQPNVVSDEWTYITYTFKYTSTTTSNLVLFFYINGNGGQILLSDPQIEVKPYATPYVTGTRGGTVATGGGLFDLSNNNNHGDINRTNIPTSSFYTPNNRGGFVFDGNNDYSRPTISHHYRDSSALEVIFNSSSHGGVFPNSYKTIMGYRHNGNYSLPTIGSIYLNNTTLSASVITTSQVYRTATFSSPIQTNQTYHVVLNKDTTNGILQLFVNGVAGNAQTFDASTYAQWSSVGNFIGANILDIGKSTNTNAGQGWGNDYFNGNIYKISVYNDILTPQQILDNYRAIKGRYGL